MVWCGSGVGFGGSPPSPPVAWCGLGGSPLHVWNLLGVFGKPMLMMILMMMMTIIMIIIITIILVFLWLVVGYLSAHVPADDYRFIDRGGTIFVTVVALGQSQ